MDTDTLLKDRYRIKETLAQGRLATTFLAVDERTSQLCVVKQLSVLSAYSQSVKEVESLSGSDAAKIVELFEREGRILAHLDHPRIPNLVDCFTVETEDDTQLYLVQQYVKARSLAQLVAAGRHFSEGEVIQIALQVTEILEYLHDRSPPLVHRDIKPSNILYGEGAEVFLIDFGAVKNHLVQYELEGSTVVGTYGYMPLEQYEANAVPASDIYSLGATLIAVLSHKEPSEIGRREAQLDFGGHVHVSKGLAAVLAKMVEPSLERRYRTAAELKRDLEALLAEKRGPALRRLVSASVVALIVLAGYGLLQSRAAHRAEDPVETAPVPSEGSAATDEPRALPQRSDAGTSAVEPRAPVARVLRLDIFQSFEFVDDPWYPEGLSVGQGLTFAGGLDTRPYETLRAEPSYRSSQVLYSYLPLGNSPDTRITFVIDELDRPTWMIYVDKNNNEDLTDDGPPYQNPLVRGRVPVTITLPVEVVTSSGTTLHRPYKLFFYVGEGREGGPYRPYFFAACHYVGKVDLGGRLFSAVAFEFGRHTGLFVESGVWIDLNGDGAFEKGTEHFLDGELVRVGDDVYRIELAYP
ncbi:MAG: serine/threonine protein kinase [Acidimicrobiia bacterium]